jgi:hypothetical protein
LSETTSKGDKDTMSSPAPLAPAPVVVAAVEAWRKSASIAVCSLASMRPFRLVS